MIDSVLSYHTNGATCGVAKFGQALAKRLGVFFGQVAVDRPRLAWPLISIKFSELRDNDVSLIPWGTYSLFLHDVPSRPEEWNYVRAAASVYAASGVIAEAVPGSVRAFCPSTVEGNPTRGAYRVLAFGMSHKLVLPHFEKLKRELDRDHPDYTIELSTAVHEGNPWDQALTESTEAMRGIFGDRLRVLGFLADDALVRLLQEVDAVAAFYVPALRANNTTAWAALSAGKFLYTNLDEHSPELNPEKYSWDALLKVLA